MVLAVILTLFSELCGLITMHITEKYQRDGVLVFLSVSSSVASWLIIIIAQCQGLLTKIFVGSFSDVCTNLFYLLSIPLFLSVVMIRALVYKNK